MLLHQLVDSVGVLTWAVGLGALAANLNVLPDSVDPGIKVVVKKLLRFGVVLLGFSVSLGAVASLGLPVIVLVVGTLMATLLGTLWLGLKAGLGKPQSLLLGTGFAICGASAIAAVQQNADADEDDVASAIGMVTIFGTLAMVAVPLLQAPLGLDDRQLGIWAGASVHEVGQVIAAAEPAGQTAVAIAITVKLTRVLLLGPVVAGISFSRSRCNTTAFTSEIRRPPMVPVFVLGFLACVLVRSAGILPDLALTVIGHAETIALSAALVGLGTAVRVRQLVSSAGPVLAVGAVSTIIVATLSLAGVLILG
jgi:uncharacterized integral membrane protein (TIGR00698 family)